MNKCKVGVFVGSLRRDSICRQMALAVAKLTPTSLQLEIIDLGKLPLYNEDLEAIPPENEWQMFRNKVRGLEGLLFITPEYNRSVPGVLKNAIDVGAAPHGEGVFDGKPGAIISLSPGAMGAFGAHHHLRQSLVFLNVPTMQQPEAYIGNSEHLFDGDGNITRQATADYLATFMKALEQWIETHITKLENAQKSRGRSETCQEMKK